MKSFHALAAVALLCNFPAFAQDQTAPGTVEKPKSTDALNPLEQKFKDLLNAATLSGKWYSLKEGALGQDREDKYRIVGANKVSGSKWVISTRIKFKDREIVAPIPVEVKWAGDTAVLIVDKLQYPGGGTYSARVLFYENTYAGTWSGGDHGGLMSGVVTKEKE